MTQPSERDPFMLNPKGVKVRVPYGQVKALLQKGFVLADKQWDEASETPETIGDELKVEKV